MNKTPAPQQDDVITIDHLPGHAFRIDRVHGYYPGEGWGVDLTSLDEPGYTCSTSLHEDYVDSPWWRPV